MAGLAPAIHVFVLDRTRTWIPGIADKFTRLRKLDASSGMTEQ
jgi:hypothetical protein